MSSMSTTTSASSTSSSSGAFVTPRHVKAAIREAQIWDISYYRIEKEDHFSLKLMAYATGAPKRSFWVKRKVRRDSGYAFRIPREDNAVSWVHRHIELGWVKVDNNGEPPYAQQPPLHPAGPAQSDDGSEGEGPFLGGPAAPNPNPRPPAGAAREPRVVYAAVPGGAVPVHPHAAGTGVQQPRPHA